MKNRSIQTISLDGGCLLFDFINTVSSRVEQNAYEYLHDYPAFLKWCVRLQVMSEQEASLFRENAARHPTQATLAMEKIIEARECAFRFFSDFIEGGPPEKEVLEQFNQLLTEALAVYGFNTDYRWQCALAPEDLSAPLSPILASVVELLRNTQRERIKRCDACGWIFMDTTKNGKRRWCNPRACGSTDKAKRYYHRKKQGGSKS